LIGSPPTPILRPVSTIYADITMSLDGFITEPNVPAGNSLGDDPGRLHDWMFDRRTDADAEVRDEVYARSGAVVIGRRMFDVGVEPWGDPPPFGMPVFVVTHEQRDAMPMQGGTTYTFVTGGIEAALEEARAAAGGKDVGIWGGGRLVSGALKAGLLDEIQIHLVPMLLGDGRRLFVDVDDRGIELERTRTIETASATHLTFKVTSRAAA
jgi:dihydrofolate reductase